jgi:hypothetical protein
MRQLRIVGGIQRMIEVDTGTASILNNQTSNANITGLLFSSADYKTVIVNYVITRSSSTTYARETGTFRAYYDSNTAEWIEPSVIYSGNNSGVSFYITTGGQLQYRSSNYGGTSYVGSIDWEVDSSI